MLVAALTAPVFPVSAAELSLDDLNGRICSQDDVSFVLTSTPSQGSHEVQLIRIVGAREVEVASKHAGNGRLLVLEEGKNSFQVRLNFSGRVLDVDCR